MSGVPVLRCAQEFTVVILFQVMRIDPKVLTSKITNIKSIEFVEHGNSFFLINLHFLLGKLGARQQTIVQKYSGLQTKKLISPGYKGVNRIAFVYVTYSK